jgi:CubicO group peptidase (beta-lactamase class C family)
MKALMRLILLSLCIGYGANSQQSNPGALVNDQLKDRIDRLAATMVEKGGPGFSVAVVRDQQVLLKAAYGMSNIEQGTPLTIESLLNIGSVSKHFTAWAILLLEQRGLLSIADDIRTYLPELPDYGKPITVSHLLYQTSGLPDYLKLFSYAGIFANDHRRFEDVYAMMKNLTTLNFPPGTSWQYSNTNYALLAEIVRRRTGVPFDAWIRDNLFQPLGMSQSVVPESRGLIVKNKAESYWRENGVIKRSTSTGYIPGPTLIYTSASDMATWMMNLKNNRIGGKELFDKLCSKGKLSDGREFLYSMGIGRAAIRGIAAVGHTGSDAGFVSEMSYYPEIDLGVAVMGNFTQLQPERVRNVILDILGFPDSTVSAKNEVPPVASADSGKRVLLQQKILGNYEVEAKGDIISLFVDRGKLWANYLRLGNVELFAKNELMATNSEGDIVVSMLDSPGGVPSRIEVNLKGTLLRASRIATDQTEVKALHAVIGRYYSPMLDAVYNISLEGDALLLKQRRSVGIHDLAYAGKSTLLCSLGELRLTYDAGGNVTGFALWHEHVNSIPFERVGK